MASISDERQARILLNLVPNIGAERLRALLERFGNVASIWNAEPRDWLAAEGMTSAVLGRLEKTRDQSEKLLKDEQAAVERHGVRVLIPTDDEFPAGLNTIPDAPLLLYVKGDLKPVDSMAVAIVGTRLPTPYGRAVAERLAGELARAGVTLVSGLARGIDTVVHVTALKNRARTLGVLGSGIDRFYPPENRPLVDKMASQGAVVSEFSMSTPPDRFNFPRRNRIIAGLSLAVLVIEADETSGALITARLAAEQGRDVFAVPGSIFSKFSRGPHRLLKQGARLVESVDDILEEIEAFRQLLRRPRPAPAQPASLSANETAILAQLSLDPAGLDAIACRSGLAAPTVISTLLEMELKGFVKALPGQAYVRTESAPVPLG